MVPLERSKAGVISQTQTSGAEAIIEAIRSRTGSPSALNMPARRVASSSVTGVVARPQQVAASAAVGVSRTVIGLS